MNLGILSNSVYVEGKKVRQYFITWLAVLRKIFLRQNPLVWLRSHLHEGQDRTENAVRGFIQKTVATI